MTLWTEEQYSIRLTDSWEQWAQPQHKPRHCCTWWAGTDSFHGCWSPCLPAAEVVVEGLVAPPLPARRIGCQRREKKEQLYTYMQQQQAFISGNVADWFIKILYLWCGCLGWFFPSFFFLGRLLGGAWGGGTRSGTLTITNACWTISRGGMHFLEKNIFINLSVECLVWF